MITITLGQRRAAACKRVAALAVVLAVIVGCASGNDQGADDRDANLEQFKTELEALIPSASEGQRAALEDGVVTRAEADRLAAEVIDCGSEKGVLINAEWQPDQRQMQFTVKADDDENIAVYRDCWSQLYDLAERSLALQNSLTGDEAAKLETGMIDCLARDGIAVSSWPSMDEVPADVESACYDEVYPQIAGG